MKKNDKDQYLVDSHAWDIFAKHKPYYHIQCDPRMEHPSGTDVEGFWKSGDEDIAFIRKFAQLEKTSGVGVDFGCGIGRITRALRQLADKQIGLDISDEMLVRARTENASFQQMEFRKILQGAWPIDSASCSLVVSYNVLQHLSSAALVERSILEMGRVLKPSGRAVFHLVTVTRAGEAAAMLKKILSGSAAVSEEKKQIRKRLAAVDQSPLSESENEELASKMMEMEFRKMHVFPLSRLKPVMRQAGLEIQTIERESSGSTWIAAVKR